MLRNSIFSRLARIAGVATVIGGGAEMITRSEQEALNRLHQTNPNAFFEYRPVRLVGGGIYIRRSIVEARR